MSKKPTVNEQIFGMSGNPLMVIGSVGEEILVDRWAITSKDGVPGVVYWSLCMNGWVLL